jgi:phospholipase C
VLLLACGDLEWARTDAVDHVALVLFENRSLDNVLGRDLSNPSLDWVDSGADHRVAPCTVAADMESPNLKSGDVYPHTNTMGHLLWAGDSNAW